MGSALTWTVIERRLVAARDYWLHTTSLDGSPHAVPVWGAVHEGRLHLYSERSTVKAANVARDPRVVVHLSDAEDVLRVLKADTARTWRLADWDASQGFWRADPAAAESPDR